MSATWEAVAAFVAPLLARFKADTPKQVRKPPAGEVGYADPSRLFPGNLVVYNPDELVTRKGYTIFDQMMRDDQVKAALAFKKQSVVSTGWTVEPPSDKDADEHEPTKFLLDMLNRVENGLDEALLDVLTALDYGFSVSEYVWEERDGKMVLAALKTRAPHFMVLETDEFGTLRGISQHLNVTKQLPLEKFLVFSHEARFGNHYGSSDLIAAYRPWWTKKNAYQWMAMLLERAGIPPILAMYNPEDYAGAQVAAINKLLRNMQGATVGSIPRPNEDSLELWAPEMAGQVSTVFIPAFEMMDKHISRALLMPGLIGMTNDETQGSLARSQVHFDVFMLVLERLRNRLARVVNEQIIEPALAYNFGTLDSKDKPRFTFQPISKDERQAILETWSTLVGAKVVNAQDKDEEHIRSMLEFPERDENDASSRMERESDAATEAEVKKAEAMPKPDIPPGGKGGFKKMALSDDQFEDLLDYAFDPDKHPRYPAGDSRGGQFAPKDGIDDLVQPSIKPKNWDSMTPEEQAAWKKKQSEASKKSREKKKLKDAGLPPKEEPPKVVAPPPPKVEPPKTVYEPPKPGDPIKGSDAWYMKHAEHYNMPLDVVRSMMDEGRPAAEIRAQAVAVLKNMESDTSITHLATQRHGMAGPIKDAGVTMLDTMRLNYERTDAGRAAAAGIIESYARSIPGEMLHGTRSITLVSTKNINDAHFAAKFGVSNFESAATGGDGHIVGYRGLVAAAASASGVAQSRFETTRALAHEMSHNVSNALYHHSTPTDPKVAAMFSEAKKGLDLSIRPSEYGMSNVAEYYAETLARYVADKTKMEKYQPKLAALAKAELDKARRAQLKKAYS